jgi:hypothetical protein
MKVLGRPSYDGGLRFMSSYGSGYASRSGTVIFYFDARGRVAAINAVLVRSLGPDIQYIWNDKLEGCSDFPGSKQPCKGS